jgi:iron complex outermembrane recepter protein
MKKSNLMVTGSAICFALCAAVPAIAQSDAPVSVQETATEENAPEDIVVTGSRIRRSEFNSPDPIQIIDPEIGKKQGQSQVADLLQSSPIAAGSVQITSSISNTFVTNGGADAQTVSLRGLGAERTLVLLNGRRAGPAGVRGSIASFDLNVLPISVVRQIEILKTGASSIYGSDAIAGVVNILTKQDFDGVEVTGFSNVPLRGGAEVFSTSATFGKRFDRGHILATFDYFNQNNLRRNQRGFLGCEEEFLTRTDGTRADISDFRTGKPACSGVLGNAILTNNDFTGFFGPQRLLAPNGQPLFVSQYGNEFAAVGIKLDDIPDIDAPSNFYGLNFDGPSTGALNQYGPAEQLSDVFSKVTRYTAFLEGAFELTDNIELYGELLYNNRKTKANGVEQFDAFLFTGNSDLPQFFCDGNFNCDPTAAGDPFNDQFAGNFLLRPLIVTPSSSGTDVDYYRGVAGARGEFGNLIPGWNWDIYGQYSRSDAKYTSDFTYADSITTQNFRTGSCVGLLTPIRGAQCLDVDFTDPRVLRGDLTPQERAFLRGRETGRTIFVQKSVEFSVSGDLFKLPAGNVGAAFGTQIRFDRIKDTPGDATLAGNVYNRSTSGITAGKTLSKEFFGEIEIPLLYNTPFIQKFTVSAAARTTKVDATRRDGVTDEFSDFTYKIGANWEVNDWLRFRGSYGTSFRAPALFELFLENQTGFLNQQDIDVCINTQNGLDRGSINQTIFDNCAAAGIPSNFQGATGGAVITSGGGFGFLKPETSTAKTASVILTPDLSSLLWGGLRANFAVDYFDIDVRDQISNLGARNIIVGCYNSQFFPDDPLCALITRAPAGSLEALNITDVFDGFINVNRQKNRGIDVTTRISQDMGKLGNLSFTSQMTWQFEDRTFLFDDTVIDGNGEAGDPKWVGDFNLTWEKDSWSVFYGLDVVGGTSNQDRYLRNNNNNPCRTSRIFRPGVAFCPDTRLSPTFYHSMSVTKSIDDAFEITLGMANIFDTKPPRASTVFAGIDAIGQAPAFGSQYDYAGRRIFLSVRGKF